MNLLKGTKNALYLGYVSTSYIDLSQENHKKWNSGNVQGDKKIMYVTSSYYSSFLTQVKLVTFEG